MGKKGNARRTPSAAAASSLHGRGAGVVSREAKSAVDTLLDLPREVRRKVMTELSLTDRKAIFLESRRDHGTLYMLWHDDPYGFVEDVIGETMWGLQRDVMDGIALPGVKRLMVPAGFGVGKTHLAGRMVAWAGATNPIGTMKIVTTATRLRQVRSQLWPHIKTAVAKGGLPGRTDTMQWVAEDSYGNVVQIAYGFSASPNDEAAMQGIHGIPKLLIVVDEAGGIAPLIGNGTNNLLTGDARLLAIGNPAMDSPGSWFERMCERGEDPEKPDTVTITISTLDSPAITGDPTPICRTCIPNYDGHTISEGVNGKSHLPNRDWLMDTFDDYGVTIAPDAPLAEILAMRGRGDVHPYIVAKVFAMFPKDSGNKIIPASWVESAVTVDDPEGPEYVALADLGLEGEDTRHIVKRGSWVRLGVDVAAGGGDEFVVARIVGDLAELRHFSSGKSNADSMVVADKVLSEIHQAQRLADALGSRAQIRVKIDSNGVGWGVYGVLRRWGEEGIHQALVIPVNVGEKPENEDDTSSMRPANKRAEMFLAGRSLLQPNRATGNGMLRLCVDKRTAAQLSTPDMKYNSAGLVLVESKDSMKARGANSPDRGEAVLLGIYEPGGAIQRKGLIV